MGNKNIKYVHKVDTNSQKAQKIILIPKQLANQIYPKKSVIFVKTKVQNKII